MVRHQGGVIQIAPQGYYCSSSGMLRCHQHRHRTTAAISKKNHLPRPRMIQLVLQRRGHAFNNFGRVAFWSKMPDFATILRKRPMIARPSQQDSLGFILLH